MKTARLQGMEASLRILEWLGFLDCTDCQLLSFLDSSSSYLFRQVSILAAGIFNQYHHMNRQRSSEFSQNVKPNGRIRS
jgi:hypothetical protein